MEDNRYNAKLEAGTILFKVAYSCDATAFADYVLEQNDNEMTAALKYAARLSRKKIMAILREMVLEGKPLPTKGDKFRERPEGYGMLLSIIKESTSVQRRGVVVNG